jgi:hypothetical protein
MMCSICQDAKNKWFHLTMGWNDLSINEIKEVFEKAFGSGAFEKTRNNRDFEIVCLHCGEKFYRR